MGSINYAHDIHALKQCILNKLFGTPSDSGLGSVVNVTRDGSASNGTMRIASRLNYRRVSYGYRGTMGIGLQCSMVSVVLYFSATSV